MKIKLGIIGESHALSSLQEVSDDYADFQLLLFTDDDETGLVELFSAHQQEADVWLLFGQDHYLRLQRGLQLERPVYYIPYRGASFYKALCAAAYRGYTVEQLSIDTIPYYDITRGLDDMGIAYTGDDLHHLADSDGSLQLPELLSFHRELFRSGVTRAAVTKSYYLKTLLEQEGIPAFCVLPMRVTIRNILNLILSRFRIKRLRESQIAIQVFSFSLLTAKEDFFAVDDLYSQQIAISQRLISYAKSINGSFKPGNEGTFYIFTTRGLLEQLTNGFTQIPELALGDGLRACGIGVGNSASEAEYHAVLALKRACADERGSWYVVLDDKTICGPLGSEEQQEYQYASAQLEEVSRATSLSQSTLSRICRALEIYGRKELSAQELATTLRITPRSARRLLTALVAHGYATESSKEMSEVKGRPRKIYTIEL